MRNLIEELQRPTSAVRELLENYPIVAREKFRVKVEYSDKYIVCLSLPFICQIHASADVITTLLSDYPEAAKKKKGGMNSLPLHMACTPVCAMGQSWSACKHKSSNEVIAALLSAYPEGTREKDSSNKLPLHYACEHKSSIDVIAALLLAYP